MFKDLGIKGRVLMLALLPAMLMALALGGYFSWMQLSGMHTNLIQRGHMVVEHLTHLAAPALVRNDVLLLERLASEALEQPDVRAVSFLAADRRVLARGGPSMLNPEPIGDTSLPALHSGNDATRFLVPVFGACYTNNTGAAIDNGRYLVGQLYGGTTSCEFSRSSSPRAS